MATLHTYITLLRGINVSGQKKIKMTDLKALYEAVGHRDVQTYIQSGNVVSRSETASPEKLTRAIEKAIEKRFGYPVTVLVRTTADLSKIVKRNPFLKDQSVDPSRLHVTFLADKVESSLSKAAADIDSADDEFRVIGTEVFVHCPNGYGRTRLSNTFFESKLKQAATTRNWKTVNTLYEMGKNLESMK
ncbi:MAG: DUF1697 domain-containing protein [Acidiferrobacterales bacterium]|nr:DUF1697 domain-containing protein [Acidiferrobacterales bacterium]